VAKVLHSYLFHQGKKDKNEEEEQYSAADEEKLIL